MDNNLVCKWYKGNDLQLMLRKDDGEYYLNDIVITPAIAHKIYNLSYENAMNLLKENNITLTN